MNHLEFEFIRLLDPKRMDGTIQSFLMMIRNQGIENVSFEESLKKIITQLKREKEYLIEDNIKLSTNGGRLE